MTPSVVGPGKSGTDGSDVLVVNRPPLIVPSSIGVLSCAAPAKSNPSARFASALTSATRTWSTTCLSAPPGKRPRYFSYSGAAISNIPLA